MAHYGWIRWYIKLIERLAASSHLERILQPRLWHNEVQFVLTASTTSQLHIVSSYVNIGALLNVWPIMVDDGGM